MDRIDLLNFDREELATELSASLELQPFRAKQLLYWIYRRRFCDFVPMTDISKTVRAQLAERYTISRPEIVRREVSQDGTRKFLLAVREGDFVESVLIKQPKRYTLCVSSQVGCAMGCTFCRTATMKLKRNLWTSEIVGQVLAVQDEVARLKETGEPVEEVQNIVFMGMGEPLHNIENTIRAVKILNDGIGLNFSGRKITVSTSGIVPAIDRFCSSDAAANLAISLNATTDEVRNLIMPVNKKWPIAKLLDTLRKYPLKHRKRITIEYVLLGGLNDTREDQKRLPKLLHGIPVKVNLIPYNENAGLGFRSPSREVVMEWQDSLFRSKLNATIRWSKGDDISAACGQLATDSLRKKQEKPGLELLN